MPDKTQLQYPSACHLSLRVLAGIVLLSGVGTAAMAQSTATGVTPPAADSQSQLQEIVVTAQKRSENVQKVPLSIVAISSEALVVAGISSPSSLTKLAPSLQVAVSAYASDVSFRIRGFGSPGNSAVDSDVATYVDGVVIARPGAVVSSMLDVRSIEVLSGPQGTLFGRNAAMGAVSINTNNPSSKRSLDATVEGSNYGTYKGNVVLNVPVTDNFAVRAAGQVSHTNGIYHNLYDHKTYGESTSYVGRISAKWDITPDVSWIVRADGSKTTGDGVVGEGVVSTASSSQIAALNGFVSHFGGTAPVEGKTPSYTFNQYVGSAFLHDSQVGITSDLSWSVSPKLTVRLIDSYHDWRNEQKTGDSIGTTVDLVDVRVKTTSKSQSHELQLVSAPGAYLGGKLGFNVGLYYFHEDFSISQNFNLGSQFCGAVYGSAPQQLAACLAAPQTNAGATDLSQKTTSLGAYGQINYAIVPTVNLTLGIRGTSDKKTGVLTQVTANPLGVAPFITAEGPDALYYKQTKPSYRASLSWQATPDIMLFTTYSTGYKAGGFNASFSPTALGSAARTFRSESVSDIEVGVKSSLFDRKLTFNASLFNTKLKDFQDRSYNGFAFLERNAGSVRSRGVDVDGRFRPVRDVTFSYGVTYLDSIYTSDTGAPGLEGCTGVVTTTVNGVSTSTGCATVQDLTGRPLEYAPKIHGNIGVNWDFGEIKGYKLTFNASETYTSSFYTTNTDNPQSKLPGYETTDLRLAVRSPDQRWELAVFGTNVFDKKYYVSAIAQPLAAQMGANNTTTGATIFRGFLGDPARYGLRLSFHM